MNPFFLRSLVLAVALTLATTGCTIVKRAATDVAAAVRDRARDYGLRGLAVTHPHATVAQTVAAKSGASWRRTQLCALPGNHGRRVSSGPS